MIPFILFETGFALNRVVMDACRRHGFEPRVVARTNQVDFIIEPAAAGMGAAFLTRIIAEQRTHRSLAWVPLHEADTDWQIARSGGAMLVCRPPRGLGWIW
ncbi:LysR substrate-binding domain-containing protein [Bradyrhizobium sp. DOA1]|uniref:LysR substrate-binding domain-containing protein n=1 Tax=Bradyrhizobium sp. DOA1 TaxID=1126616 RepID=UPI001FDA7B6C|nr:LysR substrate-binding domain-containing protein [Bradyrhizobium sp. DOA1]